MNALLIRLSFPRAMMLLGLGILMPYCTGVAADSTAPPRRPPCKATLTIGNSNVVLNGPVEFSLVVRNTESRDITLLNPLNSPMVPTYTMVLLIADSDGKVVGDLYSFRRFGGSQGPQVSEAYWVTLPPGGIIGTKDKVRARLVAGGHQQIEAGMYRIQAVFLDTFVSDYPYIGLPDPYFLPERDNDPRYVARFKQWNEAHPGKELFRSNAVDIVIGGD